MEKSANSSPTGAQAAWNCTVLGKGERNQTGLWLAGHRWNILLFISYWAAYCNQQKSTLCFWAFSISSTLALSTCDFAWRQAARSAEHREWKP